MEANKDIQAILAEIKRHADDLKEFEADINKQKNKLSELKKQQEDNFDFNRSNEINTIDLEVRNAESELLNQRAKYDKFKKRKQTELSNLANADRAEQVYQDKKLTMKLEAVKQAYNELKANHSEYINYINELWDEYATTYGPGQYLNGGSINGYREPDTRVFENQRLEKSLNDLLKVEG